MFVASAGRNENSDNAKKKAPACAEALLTIRSSSGSSYAERGRKLVKPRPLDVSLIELSCYSSGAPPVEVIVVAPTVVTIDPYEPV